MWVFKLQEYCPKNFAQVLVAKDNLKWVIKEAGVDNISFTDATGNLLPKAAAKEFLLGSNQ